MTSRAFDTSGYVLRARRRADLSQRDLARALQTSQSTVSRMENDPRAVRVDDLVHVLALAGLRLAVVDDDGTEHRAVSQEAVRDNAGRRFPAHLDVQPPDVLPRERLDSPRYDRPPARAWYHHRLVRDWYRSLEHPGDHPTVAELAERRRQLLLRQIPWRFEAPIELWPLDSLRGIPPPG